MKILDCSTCGSSKPSSEFYRHNKHKRGYRYSCKECTKKYAIEWNRDNPPKRLETNRKWAIANRKALKASHLRCTYGITQEEYDAMVISQGGLCAICRRKPKGRSLDVDHSHRTGRVRALLCGPCNTAIGLLRENPDTMLEAVRYVLRDQAWNIGFRMDDNQAITLIAPIKEGSDRVN